MSKFSLPKEEESTVDTEALRAFAAGAKEHKVDEPLPWQFHDPEDSPRYNVTVRLNDYHLEQLRWLAKQYDWSQQKVLRKLLLPAIEAWIEKET